MGMVSHEIEFQNLDDQKENYQIDILKFFEKIYTDCVYICIHSMWNRPYNVAFPYFSLLIFKEKVLH